MRAAWRREAVADLANVLAYIADRDPAAASTVAARIDHAIRLIGRFPRAGRFDADTRTREYVLRGLPLLVVYEERDGRVEIIAIFHTSRDPGGKRRA